MKKRKWGGNMNTPFLYKKCTTCGKWLVASTDNYYRQKRGKYGLVSQCKECKKQYCGAGPEYHKQWYEANKEQYINNYDYSQVFPSMIPHNRLSFSLNKYFPLFKYSIYRAKMTFNKIFNFENNIKLTNELKTNYIYDLLNFSKINISSETSIKKSISFFNQQNKKYSHITSGFSAISKLLEMTIPNKQNEISSVNFFIRNLLTFRFENINLPFIRNISEKISPYTSIETFILPKSKPVLRSILSLGFGIKLQDKFYLDFSLYTKASENINIKKHLINRLRIKIGN